MAAGAAAGPVAPGAVPRAAEGTQPAGNAQPSARCPVPRPGQAEGWQQHQTMPGAVSGTAGVSWAGEGTSALGKVYSFPVPLEMTLIKKTDLD